MEDKEKITTNGKSLLDKHDLLEGIKQDLITSKGILNTCTKFSPKYKFYVAHIDWLEEEIKRL